MLLKPTISHVIIPFSIKNKEGTLQTEINIKSLIPIFDLSSQELIDELNTSTQKKFYSKFFNTIFIYRIEFLQLKQLC